MCAAPGGKTTMMAQLMEDRGEVIALDRTHAKVSLGKRLNRGHMILQEFVHACLFIHSFIHS
jgi:16S rRNA C967 or C1407 C5-methylase (RsmB/RsmF family)